MVLSCNRKALDVSASRGQPVSGTTWECTGGGLHLSVALARRRPPRARETRYGRKGPHDQPDDAGGTCSDRGGAARATQGDDFYAGLDAGRSTKAGASAWDHGDLTH